MIKHLLLIFILLALNSCSNIIPANFWKEYEKDLITDFSSDHGPYGGTTIISWSSDKKKLNENSLISFAQNNDWKIVDSSQWKTKFLRKKLRYRIIGTIW